MSNSIPLKPKAPSPSRQTTYRSSPSPIDEFTCTVEEASDQGDTVVVTALFKGTNKSGAELDAREEHLWEIRDGKIVRFENKVDPEAWAKGWS